MKTYSHEDVRRASLDYFGGDELAADVFASKYALQDLDGRLYELTPRDMHERLAREFARVEAAYPRSMSYEEILDLFKDWTIVPQGGPMSAIGNPFQIQTLSNCFVIDSPHDSYGGILLTDQEQVHIMKRRGGVGFDVSTLRPKGSQTANAARTSDGVTVFMERFSHTCREVAQGGRRGALMLTISVHHPDVLAFANAKRDRNKITGANVSIRMTDEFLRAVKDGTTYQQRFPVERDAEHVITKDVDARTVWNEIISAMRDCSEPGMLFWDTITTQSPADAYAAVGFKTTSTNPCGELALPPGEACRLMIINLSRFVINPFTSEPVFDEARFAHVVRKAQRLSDDLVDLEVEAIDRILRKVENDPEPAGVKAVELDLWKRVRSKAVAGRRTGLGITALADTFAYLGMKYGSDESIAFTEKVYKLLAINSYRSSVAMAEERGAFPAFDVNIEKDHPFIKRVMAEDIDMRDRYFNFGRRNIANLTTSPAGTVSLETQTTSGCEPVLFLSARRKRKIVGTDQVDRVDHVDAQGDRWQYYTVNHPGVKKWMDVTGKTDPAESPYFGSTVEEIDYIRKLDVQAAAQHWLCHSVSNTLNLPTDVSVDDVSRACMHAWESGCKGITVYRIGSRDAVIVKDDDGKQPGPRTALGIVETSAPKRPKKLPCDIHRTSVQGEQYLVLVGLLDGRPYEIFAGLQEHVTLPKKVKHGFLTKNGKNQDGVATYNLRIPLEDDDDILCRDIVNLFDNPVYGAFTRTISLALRHGIPLQQLVEQLRKDKRSIVTSFAACIARVLSKNYIPDGTSNTSDTCPACKGRNLKYQQGCVVCFDCGASKCG